MGVSICDLKCLTHIISDVFCIQYVKDDNKSLSDCTYLSLGHSGYSGYQYYPFAQSEKNYNFVDYPYGLNPNLNEFLDGVIAASDVLVYKGKYKIAKEFMNKFDSLVKETFISNAKKLVDTEK